MNSAHEQLVLFAMQYNMAFGDLIILFYEFRQLNERVMDI